MDYFNYTNWFDVNKSTNKEKLNFQTSDVYPILDETRKTMNTYV